ncbi:MAG: AAA family ATPase [Bacteroidota bacterium]
MFYRDIEVDLLKWKNSDDRKPLILRGARQVGKTTVVNNFSKQFDSYICLNLEKSEHKQIFENNKDINTIVDAIFFLGKKQKNKSTLIFIDEIQNSHAAIALLRYFYEEYPKLFVIAAGSLLETLLDTHISFPVGRVEYLALRPCSFNEFLLATGNQMAAELRKQYPFPDYAHDELLKLFNRYALIGGMPAALKKYVQYQDLTRLNAEYQSLIVGYADDVEKYAIKNSSARYIRHIINTGFSSASQRIKFERFGNSEYHSREMAEAFRILEKTMLLELVYPSNSVQLPIIADYSKSPRLHWLDTGLVNYVAKIQTEVFESKDISSAWRGLIAEHIVGQELIANNNDVRHHRAFWVRNAKNSNAEIDYLIQFKNNIIPIEVKSLAGSSLKSLHQFMTVTSHDIAIRIWSKPFSIDMIKLDSGKTFRLINIPFYLSSEIERILEQIIKS